MKPDMIYSDWWSISGPRGPLPYADNFLDAVLFFAGADPASIAAEELMRALQSGRQGVEPWRHAMDRADETVSGGRG